MLGLIWVKGKRLQVVHLTPVKTQENLPAFTEKKGKWGEPFRKFQLNGGFGKGNDICSVWFFFFFLSKQMSIWLTKTARNDWESGEPVWHPSPAAAERTSCQVTAGEETRMSLIWLRGKACDARQQCVIDILLTSIQFGSKTKRGNFRGNTLQLHRFVSSFSH